MTGADLAYLAASLILLVLSATGLVFSGAIADWLVRANQGWPADPGNVMRHPSGREKSRTGNKRTTSRSAVKELGALLEQRTSSYTYQNVVITLTIAGIAASVLLALLAFSVIEVE